MKHPTRPGDLSMHEAADMLHPVMTKLVDDVEVYMKWTCPSCGERVLSDDKLTLDQATGKVVFRPKYMHTAKEDGSPCMISVDVLEYVFGCQIRYKL